MAIEKKFSSAEFGYEATIGKVAGQADGAVWLQQGGTVVLATVVSAPSKEFPGFLPLTVDYREQFAAAGRIPGGYFKREGKPSDKEVLNGRIIDRAIRPLFPENYFNQLQITSTVYSVDKESIPHTLSLLAASLALTISKVPFLGPVGVAEIVRINGKLISNPTYTQTLACDARITVAGTHEGICMVEGSMHEIAETELIDALFMAHEVIKRQVAWQKSIAQEVGAAKEVVVDHFDWATWVGYSENILTDNAVEKLFNADKVEREEARQILQDQFLTMYEEKIVADEISPTFVEYVFDMTLKKKINELIFTLRKRVDLRDFETIRPITIDVGLLPYNHGSALFTRGRTQALVSATLGSGEDELKIEDIRGESTDGAFMLHYNFPPFSVGEVRPNRGPGRREVGHGYLAASALRPMLPTKEEFSYTIRIVADMLESDGSTSMATVCGGTMALINAGVPIKKMVSGVAMGLLQNKEGRFQVITDIAGIEDEFGLMDFKVAGSDTGVTAIQMDIKYKGGLPRELFESALAQAKRGRLFILQKMVAVSAQPNPRLAELVPQIVSFKVPTDKIGAIIGTGGKVIREIIDKTGTQIDIADDGLVKIFGYPGEKLDTAVSWVKVLGGLIERGSRYTGRIKRIADFGFFVELVPGFDGLVHVSTIPRQEQDQMFKKLRIDDHVTVEVLDYDSESGKVRLKIVG
jgi:polyribonucleotide nucleotidyltransferase